MRMKDQNEKGKGCLSMDEIRIEHLEVYAGHGVFQDENKNGQRFFVNAVLETDIRQAGEADELTLSTHYGEVAWLISKFLKENTFKLIETAAEKTAEQVLLNFPLVHAIDLEIRKPDAPIGLPFEFVSVRIRRGWKKAYIGIGSNMGNKREYLETAVNRLKENEKIRRIRVSSFIETKPYGGVEQDDFLNGVIEIETLLTPYTLLAFLQTLEQEAGRERTVHWGPRTLDLDILFYEDFISDEPKLMVPHPDMQNREFVLKPLNELCPYYRNPVLGKSVRQMFTELENKQFRKSACGMNGDSYEQ